MPDIDDIWDDEEDMRMHGGAVAERRPRLCRDIFDSNADGFIADLSAKIAKIKIVRSSTEIGGDYNHTLTRYLGMLEAAKIAAKAHRDITLLDHGA